jgi:hypothetical protein
VRNRTRRHAAGTWPRSLVQGIGLSCYCLASLARAPLARADAPDLVCTAWAARLNLSTQTAVLYDHSRGRGFLFQKGLCRDLDSGDDFRLVGPLAVFVVNTNSAFYDYSVTQEKVEAPELKELRTFTKALGPYLGELGIQIWGPPQQKIAQAFKAPWEADVARIQSLLYVSLPATTTALEAALEDMRGIEASLSGLPAASDVGARLDVIDKSLVAVTDSLKSAIVRTAPGTPVTAALCDGLIDGRAFTLDAARGDYALLTIPCLNAAYQSLAAHLKTLAAVPAEAKKTQDAYPRVMKAAYDVEGLGATVLQASLWKRLKVIKVTMTAGRAVTLKVTPAAAEEIGRVAAQGPKEFKFGARPDWLIRPSVALAFLAAPKAAYPTFSTKAAGDSVEIVQSGSQDSRFTYGLSLGFTWRGLDGRDGNGLAVWLPELTVNPSSDVKAVGAGMAASWGIFKIGTGALWTKHTSLDGQAVGQILAAAGDLRTKEAYGKPRFYLGLSIFGWAPFEP